MLKRKNKQLVEYVAEYLNRLPADHEVNQEFGEKLVYSPKMGVGDSKRNVFLFAFPNTQDEYSVDDTLDLPFNAGLSRKPAVCIVPLTGSAPRYAMGAYEPGFSILCRHVYHGRGYACCEALIALLNLRSRVFPQNGCIFATLSQPALLSDLPGNAASVYRAMFQVKVAERIR